MSVLKPISHKSFLERNRKLIARYGITQSDYQLMLDAQKGKCAICKSTYPQREGSYYLCVDHDHDSGMVRGLLCHKCNVNIGRVGESVEWLKAAIKYLEGK